MSGRTEDGGTGWPVLEPTLGSQPDDGGPAFPVSIGSLGDQHVCGPGMSLRDWFAGQALVTIGRGSEQWRAMEAYRQADAMIAARKGGAS